ncbi:MAG: enoyl-CoA hydratase/isomerase family protein [Dehalococcoidales bacterium]|nr:enoyl-CoA hydratase/isomerase family protein [Dehalococcoidales bacterium]
MAYKQILYENDNGVAVITLNKPEHLNAVGGQMKGEILEALNEASADPEVWGLILTGAGRAFSSGLFQPIGGKKDADYEPALSEDGRPQEYFYKLPGDEERALLGLSSGSPHLVERLLHFDKPTIAAVNGIAAGNAVTYLCACDIRIASDLARLRLAFTRSGMPAPWSSCSYLLTKIVGVGHALELAYTNDVIDAREMERIGLVNRVVPHNELVPYCKEMIKRMRQTGPSILFSTKRAIRMCGDVTPNDVERGVMYENWAANVTLEEERAEARESLKERRQPVYKGRGIKTNIRW